MIKLHTLYWPNIDKRIVAAHRAWSRSLGIDIIYDEIAMDHGVWLRQKLKDELRGEEYVGFIDIDCIAATRETVERHIEFAISGETFIGAAQCANFSHRSQQIYAAPAYTVVSRAAWHRLGRPDPTAGRNHDALQTLSLVADRRQFPYRVLYPKAYHHAPNGGAWRLGHYGSYGIGTIYGDDIFHLFQSRMSDDVKLFEYVVDAVISRGELPHQEISANAAADLARMAWRADDHGWAAAARNAYSVTRNATDRRLRAALRSAFQSQK